MYSIVFLSSLAMSLSLGSCHVFRLGECPEVQPMADFQMDKFLGEWYIIQKFRSASDCVKENFTKIHDQYYVRRTSKPFGSPVVTTSSGEVVFRSNESQAEMEIDYPLSVTGVINLKHYIIIATDYENYALVWNCHKMIVGHRQSAQIMSRNSTLEKKVIHELREAFAHYDLNENYFTIVNQKDCEDMDKRISSGVVYDEPDCKKDDKDHSLSKSISVKIGPFHFSASLPFK